MDKILNLLIQYLPQLSLFVSGTIFGSLVTVHLGSLITFMRISKHVVAGGDLVDQSNAQAGGDNIGGHKIIIER